MSQEKLRFRFQIRETKDSIERRFKVHHHKRKDVSTMQMNLQLEIYT